MLEAFLDSNANLVNFLIGILGLILSVLSVYFGREAYRVAQQIFENGLNVDKGKVLTQVSLEFVTGVIIPFFDFKIATKTIWEHPQNSQRASTVRDNLENNKITVAFPYYDTHKGDIWDSLTVCKGMEQAEAFNAIRNFVFCARKLDRGCKDLCGRMNDFLSNNPNATLADFINADRGSNEAMFNSGKQLLYDLNNYIKALPDELKIPEMVEKLRQSD